MIEFDAANAAVEAALAAGARYADARVMHRRHESMSARNGEVRELSRGDVQIARRGDAICRLAGAFRATAVAPAGRDCCHER